MGAHLGLLAAGALAALAGIILWSRWGGLIWISDFVAWCA